ncbi:MAG: ATP-binding domain-containing protein, partial [Terracidiphilus sp.]
VGDPAQLPPIGPGLVLHALAGLTSVHQTELKTVLRQSTESGIPQIAAAIRVHSKPAWMNSVTQLQSGVSFIQCEQSRIADTIQDLYTRLGGTGSDYSVQVLSITNKGTAGVRDLNRRFHDVLQSNAEAVQLFDPEQGVSPATTLDGVPFAVGDLVMFTENDYKLNLRNGSLGKISRRLVVAGPDEPCCVVEFDGIPVELSSRQMDKLVHSYAISVHKAQGNEFRRVIVAVKQSRLLDQALLYTAVTRGVQQVVLVGDESMALSAISAPASSHRRHTGLSDLIAERLA